MTSLLTVFFSSTLQVLEGHTDEIFSCAFNYEGNIIITGNIHVCKCWLTHKGQGLDVRCEFCFDLGMVFCLLLIILKAAVKITGRPFPLKGCLATLGNGEHASHLTFVIIKK